MQGRGLKLGKRHRLFTDKLVAPYAGAWIETYISSNTYISLASPLMQGRGLKHLLCHLRCLPILSPLMQGRGLKLVNHFRILIINDVAPYAGAWIETSLV